MIKKEPVINVLTNEPNVIVDKLDLNVKIQ